MENLIPKGSLNIARHGVPGLRYEVPGRRRGEFDPEGIIEYSPARSAGFKVRSAA